MTLLAAWSEIVTDWRGAFPQRRTVQRAVCQGLGALVCVGRRCLTRLLWTQGRQQRSWASEYFLHAAATPVVAPCPFALQRPSR